jgi:hypothetical protein
MLSRKRRHWLDESCLVGIMRPGKRVPNQLKESNAFPHPTAIHLTIEARESTSRSALVPSVSSASKVSS